MVNVKKRKLLDKLVSRLSDEYPIFKIVTSNSMFDHGAAATGAAENVVGFHNLDKPLQQRILSFLCDPIDLLNSERSCKSLRCALTDDTVWTAASNGYTLEYPGVSRREISCIAKAVAAAKRYQNCTQSIILSILGPIHWKVLVESLFQFGPRASRGHRLDRHAVPPFLHEVSRTLYYSPLVGHHLFRLRGDTLGVPLTLVEAETVN